MGGREGGREKGWYNKRIMIWNQSPYTTAKAKTEAKAEATAKAKAEATAKAKAEATAKA
jgi:hypothetical protein